MEIHIRPGTENDLPQVLAMIHELAAFENAPDAVTNSLEKMKAELQHFHFLIAEADGQVAGMALYFYAYYTWVGKSLYLDDLFVREAFRGKGIGETLLTKVMHIAKAEGCHRIRWQVLHWNEDAIRFYQKFPVNLSKEWLNCDLEENSFELLN